MTRCARLRRACDHSVRSLAMTRCARLRRACDHSVRSLAMTRCARLRRACDHHEMPELPEVEVVRRGLQAHVVGKTITAVRVHHPRAVRRHDAGPADLTARLLDARITGADRRGKYLWLMLETPDGADPDTALVVHLGMSGQMLLGVVPRTDHVRI